MSNPKQDLPVGKSRVCVICKSKFQPQVRLKGRQKTCAADQCRLALKRKYLRQWRSKNPEATIGYLQKHKKPPGFWPRYRDANPNATQRNREQVKLRAQLKRQCLQRNLDICQAAENPTKIEAFTRFATIHRWSISKAFGKANTS